MAMTDSKFNMWRGCVAVVHLDQKVSKEEKAWVEQKIQNLPLTDEQRTILVKDLEGGIDIPGIVEHITEKKDLAFLLHMLRTIGHLDHDFSDPEREAFKKLEERIMKGIDLRSISQEIEAVETASYTSREKYKTYNQPSIFESAVNSFLKFID